MEDAVAIKIRGLGKRYQLGQTVDLRRTFRETLMSLPGFMGRRLRRRFARQGLASVQAIAEDPETPHGTFWALRDVDLDVRPGEVVGVIGRNGAGKSTLLKILSRITSPTTGEAEIRGRVGALLEVGTGFHSELSGRVNIYLSGAILGMRKTEIDRKFDEIVAFAEVDQFLDTPVKRYSSGMYVRLAFAVAAHLEPEVLIVDEVLAVGDASFQRKCLGKMNDVASGGRTVLFVSHNMAAVEGLCTRGVVLQAGRVAYDGPTRGALEAYGRMQTLRTVSLADRKDRQGTGAARVQAIRILDADGKPAQSIAMGESFTVELVVEGKIPSMHLAIMLGSALRTQMLRCHSFEQVADEVRLDGALTVRCKFVDCPLMHGTYDIHIWLGQRAEAVDFVQNAEVLTIEPRDVYGTGRLPDPLGGVAFCRGEWTFSQ
jgi:lipopolysaccharide transport system ATP-binding protein